jgi:hypothetical protein
MRVLGFLAFLISQIFFTSISRANSFEAWVVAPLFRDHLEFLVCENQPCPSGFLRASAEVLLAELRKEGVSVSMTGSQFCRCQDPLANLEDFVPATSAELVREIARGWVRALKSIKKTDGPWIQDLIVKQIKPIYSRFINQRKGSDTFSKMQMRAVDLVKRTQSIKSLSQDDRVFIIKMAYLTGSIRNSNPVKKSCRGRQLKDFSCLSFEEIEAAKDYMGHEYNLFNQTAVSGASQNPQMAQKVKNLIQLISKLEPAKTLTFRGTGASPGLLHTPIGQVYVEPIFMSSSLDSKISQRFLGGAAQILLTKNCPLISGSASLWEAELEVLCKPRTALKMVHYEYRGGNVYFFMEEE